MSWEVWGPPLVVVLIGLVAGLLVALRSQASARPAQTSLTADDLLARKDSLVGQLRSLEADRAKLPPAEFADRWSRTLDLAAAALRDHEAALGLEAQPATAPAGAASTAPATSPAAAASTSAPTLGRRLGIGAAVVGFFVLLGLTLSQFSKPRSADGSMTGTTVDSRLAAIEEAKARLAEDPSDVDAAAFLAHAAIRSGQLDQGMQYVDAGRKASPDDTRIQSSLAALMISIGYLDRAESVLDEVQARDPALSQAWLWRGVLLLSRGDKPGAEQAFTKVLELSDDAEDRRLAAGLRADLAKPAAAEHVTGRVVLAEGTPVPDGALLFIYARRSEVAAGPPLAALRLPASGLPLEFSLGDDDILMQGQTWPDQVWLQARIDTDGNAMTQDEGAPATAVVGPVPSGGEPITLTLALP